jgi:hypothetical protein
MQMKLCRKHKRVGQYRAASRTCRCRFVALCKPSALAPSAYAWKGPRVRIERVSRVKRVSVRRVRRGRQADRQTTRQAKRTHRQTDRQTDRHAKAYKDY